MKGMVTRLRVSARRVGLQVAAGALLCLVAGPGAATAGNSTVSEIAVALQDDGSFLVAGQKTDLPHLTQKLKSAGVTEKMVLKIAIPERTNADLLTKIGRELASHGFKQFAFVKPKRAVSFTQGQPAPAGR